MGFSLIFVAYTKIFVGYNFGAPLKLIIFNLTVVICSFWTLLFLELLGRSMGRSIILPLKVVKVTKCPAGENQKFKTFRCLKTKFKSNKITRECIYIFFSNFHGFGILFCFFLSFLFWRWLWNPLKPTPLCATALEAVVWSCFVNKLFLKICKTYWKIPVLYWLY